MVIFGKSSAQRKQNKKHYLFTASVALQWLIKDTYIPFLNNNVVLF